MNTLFVIFSFIFVFAIPVGIIFYKIYKKEDPLYQEASLICLFSLIFLMVINIEKIEVFKLWGLEAQLKKTIAEANATLKQLQDMALSLSTPVYSELALQGMFMHTVTFENRYQYKLSLDKSLEEVGIPKEKIEEASKLWTIVAAYGLSLLITKDDKGETILTEADAKEWDTLSCLYFKDDKFIPADQIQKFLEDKKLLNTTTEEKLSDYRFFLAKKEIRRTERWRAGFSPLPPCGE